MNGKIDHPKIPSGMPGIKSWWEGDARVEPYMPKVMEAINRNVVDPNARTDIYNRCYEAIYQSIKDYTNPARMNK